MIAETEEQARAYYLEFTGLPPEEAFDEAAAYEFSPESKCNVADEDAEPILMTYQEAFEQGYFTLPTIFTYDS